MKTTTILTTTFLLFSAFVRAQSPVGDWKGTLAMQGMELDFVFHIQDNNGTLSATLDVPMQGAAGVPLDQVTLADGKVTISSATLKLSFTGECTGDKMVGTFKQMDLEVPVTLQKFVAKLPGNTLLVTPDEELDKLAAHDTGQYKYQVADYFARPKSSNFQLSPNGKYLSYMEKAQNGKNHVYVKNIATGQVNRAIEETDEPIKGYAWINDERLLYIMDQGGNENYHIYATNLDASNTIDLTPFDGVMAQLQSMLKEQKDFIIVLLNKNNPQIFEPYKLNVVTGDLEQLFQNNNVAEPIQGYNFDKDGQLRAYTKMVNGVNMQMFYKDLKTNEFNLIKEMNWDENFSIINFNYASTNPDEAYVKTNLESDKTRIVLYDLKKNRMIKEVFSNPDFDVARCHLSRKRNWEIDYFSYLGQKLQTVPVSKTYKKIDQLLHKHFGDKQFQIVDYDDNETTLLVLVRSDRLYGTYYQLDTKTMELKLLYDLMPQLHEADMAPMRPIAFKSRDGLTIHGYITLPQAALQGKKVPLVVNPHGGPQGIRDEWDFNPETQLFASRGYATLQVNFRISGGYGKAFLRAGFKQIGRKLMDDIEDGVKYVIEQGWADPNKIAIYGGSHGGYATLMGLVKTPDLYCCGIDYVGISSIFTFFNSFPEYWKPLAQMAKQIWYDVDNPEEAAIAKTVSPFFQINRIKKPLFVVQGANDPRVNINESDQMVTALRANGFEVPYMVKYNEGHGFYREENRLHFYRCMLGFLAQQFAKINIK